MYEDQICFSIEAGLSALKCFTLNGIIYAVLSHTRLTETTSKSYFVNSLQKQFYQVLTARQTLIQNK